MRRIVYIFILLPLFCAAQTNKLTLSECLELAKEQNHQMEAASFGLQKAQYDARSVKANFFPSLSLSGMGIYTTAEGKYSSGSGMLPVFAANGQPTGASAYFPGLDLAYEIGMMYNAGIKVEQPLYMGGKVRHGYGMMRLGSEIAAQNVKLTEQQVIVATSKAYANAVKAKEMLRVANSYNALLKELMRSVEKAKKHGMKSQNDLLKVTVKLNESELNVRKAENGYRLASMNLCHYIGYSLTSEIEIDTLLPVADYNLPDRSASIVNRPEYIMLEKKSELARKNIAYVRSEGLPQIGLMGQYGYLQGFKLNDQTMFNDWNLLVGVKVSVPIFNFGNKANKVRSAQAAYKQTIAEQTDKNHMLELEMMQAANNLNEAALELQLAESSVAAAKENMRVSKRQYDAGMEMLSDYLEAQTMWHKAEETHIEARINRYLLLIEYLKASGSM